jgi:hypothetical protein
MDLTGKIVKVLALQTGQGKTGNSWKKQEYVIEYGDQYPKQVCFNLWGDKVDQFALSEGDAVTIHFDIESREFNGRYYTDVKAWKVDKADAASAAMVASSGPKSEFGMPAPDFLNSDDKDDLPF